MTSRIQAIGSLARELMAGELPAERLGSAVQAAGLTRIPSRAVEQINTQINHSPRTARALASVVKEIARRSPDVRGRTEPRLLYVRTLNSLGEFRNAAAESQHAARAFLTSRAFHPAARAWLEAAWAETYLAHLDTARKHLAQARALVPPQSDSTLEARGELIEGRILREEGNYKQAKLRFERARALYQKAGEVLEAARCLRELGHNRTRSDASAALPILAQAHRIFEPADCPVEVALCDHFSGQALHKLGRFQEALEKLAAARQVFSDQGAEFYAAWSDVDTGIVHWYLGHFETALPLFQRSREYFLTHGIESEASTCDINVAIVLLQHNRYEEALEPLRSAAKLALHLGQRKKAAICFMNMGYAYDKQSHYAPALESYQRAREEFAAERVLDQVARSDVNLGLTLFNLGEYDEAMQALGQAAELARTEGMRAILAECELDRGKIFLALGQNQAAHSALLQARQLFVEAGQEVHVAISDLHIAAAEMGDKRSALERLQRSRELFLEHSQLIDAALCDLIRGELHLAWKEWQEARLHLQHARAVLYPGFPDDAWRADYALGKVALAQGMEQEAKRHHLDAVAAITSMRAGLGLERLSNDLFGARQQVFVDALSLVRREPGGSTALGVIQSAKAQTLMTFLGRRDWRARRDDHDDVESAALIRRERELRLELEALRRRVSLATAYREGEALRGPSELESISTQTLSQLNEATRAYESLAANLRLAWRGLSGVPALAPFSIDSFRETARAQWGEHWAALEYYLFGDELTIACLGPYDLRIESVSLTAQDRTALQRCTGTHPDLRKLVYHGLEGKRVSATTAKYLRQLAEKLIPSTVRASHDELTLIIAPHGPLHYLPFHALLDGDEYLIERFDIVYTPSLQALGQLLSDTPGDADQSRMLLCGLEQFGRRAAPLEHTSREIQTVKAGGNGNVTALWQEGATRRWIMESNVSGELGRFGVLHFATHAILQPKAPHSSRILLADDDLTALDVMDLRLDARLVMLSACSTALGAEGKGDEFLGLARAFFYAGARALVVSLWAVDDESTSRFMVEFYRNLAVGESIARALRAAQLEMMRAGLAPYYWAPFVAIGGA